MAGAFVLGSCHSDTAANAAMNLPATPVDVQTLKAATVDLTWSFPGTVEGVENVSIRPQVIGYLDKIYVQEGSYVEKGQALFGIRDDVYREQVQNSDAALKAAEAAEKAAQLEVQKLESLVAGGVVSQVQLETAESNYESAKAQVAQAKANLGSSQINQDYTEIKAPFSGYIGRIPNRLGNLVSSTDTEPLTQLAKIDQVFVYFSMSEADFLAYEKKKASYPDITKNVTLELPDGSVYKHTGTLLEASGNFNTATASMSMKAVFPNPDKLLRSGGTGRVVLHYKESNVLEVPKIAVKDIQDKFFVYQVTKEQKAKMTEVTFSGASDESYFIASGIQNGAVIALNPIDRLADGISVAPSTESTQPQK
ncbi:RND transporter [Neptunitalea sp. Y10]|uniref:RND transporter n=1 Tax=Neptunitalea lumnitzerae TaxID=2965509 RepID=A0ABQ5MJ31_9FLAO|nr:RND transporter [Neptunitalea sp. Y10]